MNLFTKQKETPNIENEFKITKGETWGRDKLGGWD